MQKTTKRLLMAMMLTVIVVGSGMAFAQTTPSSSIPDVSGIPSINSGIAKWFVGVIWASVGFAVAKANGEKFDPLNFGTTILIGMVLCVLTTFGNVDPNVALGITGFLTPILDKLLGKKTSPAQKTGP